MAYRTKDEIDLWRQHDSLIEYLVEYLLENKIASEDQLDAYTDNVKERLINVVKAAVSLEISPRIALDSEEIGDMMFSNGAVEALDKRKPEVLQSREESRLKVTQEKFRFGLDDKGKALPKLKCITYTEALFEAMAHRFFEDATMVAYGEENRDWGGAFGVYRGLADVALSSTL